MEKAAIFISDLHLGQGDKLDDFPLENEKALVKFLKSQSEQGRGSDLDLVVLGDFMDIWQVADEHEKEARKSTEIDIDVLEDDQLRRARLIIAAHSAAFEALGGFLEVDSERRRVDFVVGNHDHSLVNQRVQEEVRNAVAGGNAAVASRIEFGLFYDEPALRVYAEHGNQHDVNNRYKNFKDFSEECPGYYFVRLFWNRFESIEPNVEVWWNSFQAIWRKKLWRLLDPAFRFFRQYRTDPRHFKRIDIPGVPFFAAPGEQSVSTTGQALPGFPDILMSETVHPVRIFSRSNEIEDLLRSLYHDPANREFKDWVDQILAEKYKGQAPPVPSTRIMNIPTYGILPDKYPSAVVAMFAPPDQGPPPRILKGSALDDDQYEFVILGHTHEEKHVPLLQHKVTYFNTGTWSGRQDSQGVNSSHLCFVKLAKGGDGVISVTQECWPL